MSPDQRREAREILKWTRPDLADAAGVTPWSSWCSRTPSAAIAATVGMLSDERRDPGRLRG
jgi:hypothetical protein